MAPVEQLAQLPGEPEKRPHLLRENVLVSYREPGLGSHLVFEVARFREHPEPAVAEGA